MIKKHVVIIVFMLVCSPFFIRPLLGKTTDYSCTLADRLFSKHSLELLKRPFERSTLEQCSIPDLRKIRNAIYATHGYIFRSNDLNYFFKKSKWYRPDASRTAQIKKGGLLSETEKKNVRIALGVEHQKILKFLLMNTITYGAASNQGHNYYFCDNGSIQLNMMLNNKTIWHYGNWKFKNNRIYIRWQEKTIEKIHDEIWFDNKGKWSKGLTFYQLFTPQGGGVVDSINYREDRCGK